MRHLTLLAAAACALLAGSAAGSAQAAAPSLYVASEPVISAVYTPADRPLLQDVQYIWGGRNYCWYDDAWNGPGYYWCGYAYRRGFGWGGVLGWHGWSHGGGHYHGASYSAHRGHFSGGHSRGGGHSGGGHGGGRSGSHSGGEHHH